MSLPRAAAGDWTDHGALRIGPLLDHYWTFLTGDLHHGTSLVADCGACEALH